MFVAVEPLDKVKHKDLRMAPMENLSFAKNVSQVPLVFSEFVQASRYYPIVFTMGENPQPRAILSLQKNHNNYLNAEGKWVVPYVPAQIRRYPFILGRAEEKGEEEASESVESKFVVCIDRKAPNLSSEKGELLFNEKGEATEITTNAIEFLKKFQAELDAGRQLFRQLLENGCMTEKKLSLDVNGIAQNVGSFQVADLSKLKDLDDKLLADWARSGILGLMYAQNYSMANLDRFAQKMKKAQIAPGNETVH